MKCIKSIYINAVAQISPQQPLTHEWMSTPRPLGEGLVEAVDPDFKQWLSAGESRRLGKILKRAIVTSSVAMTRSGVPKPDAIITATGLGCVKNTELFLTDLCFGGEQLLKPTQFMQSTHNTIGSLIAIMNDCKGYNATFSHGAVSAEVALIDALTLLHLGDASTVLLGAHDEMTPCYFDMLKRAGSMGQSGMVATGEAAVSFILSGHQTPSLCRIASVEVLHRPSAEDIREAMTGVGPVDCIVAGYNGLPSVDARYDDIINEYFSHCRVLRYKERFGEGMTASACGLYEGAVRIASGECRDLLCLNISGDNLAIIKLTV